VTTPTVDDLAVLLGRELSSSELAQADAALRFATAAVSAYLPTLSFEVVEETAKIRGTWSRVLQLPKHPVTAVQSVSINSVELDPSAWTWRGKDHLIKGPWYPDDDVDDLAFDVIQGASPGPVFHWGGPLSVVEVTYSHGLQTFPEPVWLVIVQAARRMFLNPEGVRQESLGGYSVTYDSADGAAGLTQAEMTLIRQYRRRAR
jgi:hypothetical protein